MSPLNHKVFCLALTASALLFLVNAGGQTPALRPHLVCDEPLFDFGSRPNTEDVDHSFSLRNTGNAPVVVSRVRSGCGCTQAQLSQNTIEPGSNAVLNARLTLRGIVGVKRTSIYLHTNDPEKPVFLCQFSGTAVTDMMVTPPEIMFTYSPTSAPVLQRLTVTGKPGSSARITGIETQGNFFMARIETNSPGYGVISVQPGTNAPAETALGVVAISTDHPRYPRLVIPIRASVIRDLSRPPPPPP